MISLYIHFKKLIVQNTKSIREWAQLSIIIPFSTQHSLDALPISALLSWSKSSCCCISRSQSGWQIELKLFFASRALKLVHVSRQSVRQSGSCLCLNQQIGLTSFPAAERRPSLWSWRDILPKCQKKWPSKNMSDSRNFKTSLAGQMIGNLDCTIVFYMGFHFLQVMNWEVLSCSLLPKGSDQVPLTKFNTYYFSKY